MSETEASAWTLSRRPKRADAGPGTVRPAAGIHDALVHLTDELKRRDQLPDDDLTEVGELIRAAIRGRL
ncbi:hypothetical protein OHT52_30980 [Streptomyces sp. NBC_00247]|uniref:hypothetical protein n=1 Tax=Streptomyces sp. NBC_00247 TaxID=2975689 RepID=UPI002E2D45B8|nr:hypothetical protein [Streptomyces sp. NBC_00247]